MTRLFFIIVMVAVASSRLSAQAENLATAVERYFEMLHDDDAEEALDELLRREDATAEALLALVRTPPKMPSGESQFSIPHMGQKLVATLRVPKGHDRTKPHLPVVFDVSRGSTRMWIPLDRFVVAYIPGYTPPQFSDEGRDAFLKVARTAAFLAHGDRLWLTGYSWAAHASYDTAVHRPGFVRGIVPSGGGPRRVWFRILRNLQPTKILSFCGAKDDPELVWNLKELRIRQKKDRLDYTLELDPTQGHNSYLRGYEVVPPAILQTPQLAPAKKGKLLVDGANVENRNVRCLYVDENRVRLPKRVGVPARLSLDQKRRATIRAMRKAVASVDWAIARKADTTTITVKPKYVPNLMVFFRLSEVNLGGRIEVKKGSKRVHAGVAKIDRRVLLAEARRTRERRDPTIFAVQLEQ